MDRVSSILKWKTDREVHPLEKEKLSDDVYIYLIVFFILMCFAMIGLYILIICIGFYRSVSETASRKVIFERENSTQVEEV